MPEALPDEVAVLTEVMAVTHGVDTALNLLGLHRGEPFAASRSPCSASARSACATFSRAGCSGAGFIAATDRLPGRLERATAFGVDVALDVGSTGEDERVAAILDATEGRGVDIALDCSGVPVTFAEALRVVRTGGVVVEAGAFVDIGGRSR